MYGGLPLGIHRPFLPYPDVFRPRTYLRYTRDMIYRTLGSTGLEVSVVGVGTWQFGGEWGVDFSPADVDAILGTAKDEGINLIDTAECYGDHLSEELIGKRTHRERDRWIIATKFGHHFHADRDRSGDWSPLEIRTRHWTGAEMRGQLEASLKALKTDYIDLLQFHSPTDEEFLNDELWEALAAVKREGKVRYIGLSVSDNTNVMQVKRAPDAGCEAIQIIYNRLDRGPEGEVFDTITAAGMGVLARVPLASGFLTGKFTKETTFAHSDWRSGWDAEKVRGMIDEVEEIRSNEVPADAPMAQWALVWPLRNPVVTAVIPGCKNVEQVQGNAQAVRWLE